MLTVKLYSFSYLKSGIPIDTTPHNGGFVFDCRYIKNPKWESELSNLNGKDKGVIEFLDNTSEMQSFLKNVENILKDAINNYLSRDFTNIMISFGCTGGQHRSVYAAEKIYSILKNHYSNNINLEITHIEFPELSMK